MKKVFTYLKAGRAFWHKETEQEKFVLKALETPVEELSREDLILIVKELDRRFLQLWDKVNYEKGK